MNRNERRRQRREKKRRARPNPGTAAAMKKAQAFMDAGDLEAAESAFRDVTRLDPLDADAFHMLALIAYSSGRMEDAGEMILEAITRNDDDPAMHANCGAIMNLLGRPEEAEAACRHVIDRDPKHAEAHNNLAVSLEVQGRLDEARDAAERAIELNPEYLEAHTNLGNILLRGGDPGKAADCYRAAIGIHPETLMARANLGVALREAGDLEAAESECRKALDLNAEFAEAHNSLGNVLKEKEDWPGAKDSFQAAMVCRPGYLEAHLNLAAATFKDGDFDGALAHYRDILETHENMAEAHGAIGVVLLAMARLDEAEDHFRKAVALKPGFGDAQYNLATAQGKDLGEPEITAIRDALKDKRLSGVDRAKLHFALGEINDQRGNFKTAFADFEAGNELRKAMLARQGHSFDADGFDKRVDAIKAVYNAGLFEKFDGGGDLSDKPVFVVGVPRSGTTLVEQIIACHPQAVGKGETEALHHVCGEDDALARADENALAEKAGAYLSALTKGAEDAARVIDKWPFNYLYLGQVQLLFPNARVVYCRRDPLDTGISCFRQYFTSPQAWSSDLEHIGRFQRASERLMEHWKKASSLSILDLQYEDMIADQEGTSRRLIEFLGLDWDAACLDFHSSGRPVLTASNWQVRQPLYASAVGRAKGYEEYLGPLKKGLGV